MAPTSSSETPARLSAALRHTLLEVARSSIEHGLARGTPLTVTPSDYPAELQARHACFVTLDRDDALRGCIGHLEAVQPLVADVAENAFAAAFRDPRFPPLSAAEWPAVTVHISVLGVPEAMQFQDQADLLAQLHPGEDGLILQEGARRGTFLPSVWDSLPDPADFLGQLKRKAGLPADHWSDRLQVWRYRSESFGDSDAG